MRISAEFAALFLLSGCATHAPATLHCYVTTTGTHQVCETKAPMPAVLIRHVVNIPADGPCKVDQDSVACAAVGSTLRKSYPNTNPQILLCPNKDTSFARVHDVLGSVGDARLFCVAVSCPSPSEDIKPVPQCQDLSHSPGSP